MIKEAVTIETVKAKYKALDHKKSFVELLATKMGRNYDHMQMVWFQKDFKIPAVHIEFVNEQLDERKVYEQKKAELLQSLRQHPNLQTQ